MWPQDVAVGYWRLLRQSVHLLIPLVVWDWKRQRSYKMKLDIHKLLGKGHKKTGNSHHTNQLDVWYWSCDIRVRWTPGSLPSFLYSLTYNFSWVICPNFLLLCWRNQSTMSSKFTTRANIWRFCTFKFCDDYICLGTPWGHSLTVGLIHLSKCQYMSALQKHWIQFL